MKGLQGIVDKDIQSVVKCSRCSRNPCCVAAADSESYRVSQLDCPFLPLPLGLEDNKDAGCEFQLHNGAVLVLKEACPFASEFGQVPLLYTIK